MEDIVNSAAVAQHLGVTPSAVSNWIKRGVLPEHLRPRTEQYMNPVWQARLLPELKEWHEARRRGRRPAAAGARPADLALLLEYVRAAKRAAAVKGHMGNELEDRYWMGASWAYQDVERLIEKKVSATRQKEGKER